MSDIEIWKDVVGYEGLYEVSSLGNIRSRDRLVRCKGGKRMCRGKSLTPHPSDRPYLHVILQNGKRLTRRVHKIVADTFLGPSNGLVVDHINGIVTDNRLCNLEYVTLRENVMRGKLSCRGNKTSKSRGVYKLNNKWRCGISFNQKGYYIGTFETELEANNAYVKVSMNDEDFFIKMVADRKAKNLKNKSSIYTGVRSSGNRWRSSIINKGNRKNLGTFDTELEAHKAYQEAKLCL